MVAVSWVLGKNGDVALGGHGVQIDGFVVRAIEHLDRVAATGRIDGRLDGREVLPATVIDSERRQQRAVFQHLDRRSSTNSSLVSIRRPTAST